MTRGNWRYAPVVLLVGLLAADWVPEDCPDCFHEGFKVDLSAVPLPVAPLPAVLFSGYRNGRCRDDLICTGAPDAAWFGYLQGKLSSKINWWNSCGSQGREMVVFAGGHAPTVLDPTELSTEIKPTLNGPAPLRIAAWVEGPDASLAIDYKARDRWDDAADQLDRAIDVFKDLGAGVEIDYVLGTYPGKLPAVLSDFIDHGKCDHANALRSATAADPDLLAMQDQGKLNVYFVQKLHNDLDGVTCAGNGDPDLTRYMILLSETRHTPHTVAHEIGHALGLILPLTLPGGVVGSYPGDINELEMSPWLDEDNLMYSGVFTVGQITLGEIYRMHFDKRSWLRRGVAAGSDYPLGCQASPVKGGLCPPLALHPTRGWP